MSRLIKRLAYMFGGYVWRSNRLVMRYEECSDDDKSYIIAYDNILYELRALRKLNYNRYKNKFMEHLSSTDASNREAAIDLLDNEFYSDKDDITKILILK